MTSGQEFVFVLCLVGLALVTGWGVFVARRESLDRIEEDKRRRLVQKELERYESD